jgi:hypothetical protein
MSAHDALNMARVVGVEIELDGNDLLLEAPKPPPAAVLDALLRNKNGIIALLRPDTDSWETEDWQVFYDERAGFLEICL